jgi:tRNA pseudouridine38-40 synthase
MIYFLHIAYDGSNYRGWQYQPNVISVQQVLEEKLKRIFKRDIVVYGCGRTDAEVHASQYILHIDLDQPIDFDLKFRLNKNLPDDIAIYGVLKMEDGQHARYDAISRTYDYYIHLYKDPLLSKYSSYYPLENLNYETMHQAAGMLCSYGDFRAVCKQPQLYKHTRCKVSHAALYVDTHQQRLRFTITADRFLRGMVRLTVSFLLKVGTGKMTLEEFEYILANKIEVPEKQSALPNGLYLSRIEYPYLKITPKTAFFKVLKMGLGEEAKVDV